MTDFAPCVYSRILAWQALQSLLSCPSVTVLFRVSRKLESERFYPMMDCSPLIMPYENWVCGRDFRMNRNHYIFILYSHTGICIRDPINFRVKSTTIIVSQIFHDRRSLITRIIRLIRLSAFRHLAVSVVAVRFCPKISKLLTFIVRNCACTAFDY